jgi:hypothetical protein
LFSLGHMRAIVVLLVAGLIGGAYCALSGTTLPIVGWDQWLSGRAQGCLLLACSAAMLFGIYMRAAIVWSAGWIFLALLAFSFAVRALPWQSSRAGGSPSMQSDFAMFLMAALCGYVAFLWYSERSYFIGGGKPEA